jgi:endonuclease YncB( thermonuclease family)
LIAALMVLASCGAGRADDLTGQASIVDGDTLEIHGMRVRLWGVDARKVVSFAGARIALRIAAVALASPCQEFQRRSAQK